MPLLQPAALRLLRDLAPEAPAVVPRVNGFPEPLRCPPGVTRRSLQLYYFTNGRPAQEASPPHPTVFRRRPQDPSAPLE